LAALGSAPILTASGAVTVSFFDFDCIYCSALNEFHYVHPPHVTPYLVTRKCSSCGRLNHLEGVRGVPNDENGRAAEEDALVEIASAGGRSPFN
jgi:hypothetical protein